MPPHFQLKTDAKTGERQKIAVEFIANCHSVRGQFGHSSIKTHDCTYGMNKKGGMTTIELSKYIKINIMPLFPDVEDTVGKRVVIKVDSGPGRNNIAMLAGLRVRGIYMCPSVPNTTQVTQEADQLYGPFKHYYRENLRLLSKERFESNPRDTMKITDLGLLVFGRKGTNQLVHLRNCFEESFSKERCLGSWSKCGAVPLTRSVLQSRHVRHEINVGKDGTELPQDDPEAAKYLELQRSNHFACDYLNTFGFDGNQLRSLAPRKPDRETLTVRHSKARVKTLLGVHTAGGHFHATGGEHLNSDDVFRAAALKERMAEVAKLEKKKETLMDNAIKLREAREIKMDKGLPERITDVKKFTGPELKALLTWKVGSHKETTKATRIARYLAEDVPDITRKWSEEDEAILVALRSDDVALKDTAIGVAAKQSAKATMSYMDELDPTTRAELLDRAMKPSIKQETAIKEAAPLARAGDDEAEAAEAFASAFAAPLTSDVDEDTFGVI